MCLIAVAAFLGLEAVPAELDTKQGAELGGHWAFQPPKRPSLPPARQPRWARTPVDTFVLQRLGDSKLHPSDTASRRTLIRRATLDLIGLPPSPSEIDAFVTDSSPSAYERLIDRLLASPHYGERWGRHWLDVARYADSGGFETDLFFGHAWRYRDYVIRALNADKPFDRFVREQIAGDEMDSDDPEARVATGLYTTGPVLQEAGMVPGKLEYDQLTDAVDTTGSAFLGLTVGCARCHDHKYDPISQRDYFGMQAVFSASDQYDFKGGVRNPGGRASLNNTLQEFEIEQMKTWARREPADTVRKQYLRRIGEYSIRQDQKLKNRLERSKRYLASLKEPQKSPNVEPPGDLVEDVDAFILVEGAKHLARDVSEIPVRILGMRERPLDVRLLKRGDLDHPGDSMGPAFPTKLARGGSITNLPPKQWRVALADWIASEQNPLTARVLVNRVWQWHFGEGLVRTPNDFGLRGERPTHPELLDWLAVEFMENGWSLKHLHRVIMLSTAYQMSSSTGSETLRRDPDNRMLTRFQPHRLEAEVIWDSLRFVAGNLNGEMHGLSVAPHLDEQEQIGNFLKWPASPPEDSNRRAVYLLIRRSFRFPMLSAFDLPDNIASCARRDVTTIPNQALTLMNNRTIKEQASAFAARLLRVAGSDPGRVVSLAWEHAYGREVTQPEREQAVEFIRSRSLALAKGSGDRLRPAVEELCLALFNTNEFIYVE